MEAEVENLQDILGAFGTLSRALRLAASRNDASALEAAARAKCADITAYLALQHFSRRKPYYHLEETLQRDIKALFGTYARAQDEARSVLFAIANTDELARACQGAAEHGLGWLDQGHSLQLHTSLVQRLPPILRVYIGCAAALYGDIETADLVKVHITSGKLTLMRFDDFVNSPLPKMLERTKIKMREQDIDIFEYGPNHPPPLLYYKSRFINEEFPRYAEQVAFEEALESLRLFDLSGFGPSATDFFAGLESTRWSINGFSLERSRRIPFLNEKCGKYFTYSDLITCGDTQRRTQVPNLPQQPDSYTALYDLAVNVIDPVVEYFGMIKLTYGFCSPELARHIPGRIDPKRDQHAAHEVNRRKRPVCERLGAAVDFLVEDEDMKLVAAWIAENTPFDRLYFYGRNLPLHVSYGPKHTRQIVEMRSGPEGRLIPKVRSSLA